MNEQAISVEEPGGYQLRLPTFEGPLDVLLRLIERQQLPIADVSLVMVTDQFFDYLAGLDEASPVTIAEFTAVGARLVLLKARSLLPRPPADDEEGDPGDLVVQLIEYRSIKEAAKHFGELDAAGNRAFVRGEHAIDLPVKQVELPLAQHEPSSLVRALKRKLVTASSPARLVAIRPMIPLREMVWKIHRSLTTTAQSYLHMSRSSCASHEEARAMFLALLVLIRRRHVDAEQHEPFGDIHVWRTDTAGSIADLMGSDELQA